MLQAKQDIVSIAQVTRRLGVTTQAVHFWRQGSLVRPPLPVEVIPCGKSQRVAIHLVELKSWLSTHRPDLLELLDHHQ